MEAFTNIMKVEQMLNCSFASWYKKFEKVTIKSKILQLPDDFIDYLLADTIVLPDSHLHTNVSSHQRNEDEEEEDENDKDEVDWTGAEMAAAEAPVFTELDSQIKECITWLGGSVFPKLNWSSPRDASWIALNNCMKCTTVSDIYLLLKSSDFITHDLTQPFKFCEDCPYQSQHPSVHWDAKNRNRRVAYHLVLRKWTEIDPSTEYRCFVKNHNIIGICQRDHTNFYEHISHQKNDIITDIRSFFKEHIYHQFPDSEYVMDVYRKSKDFVRLVDFNPFGPVTDALLFDWEELENKIPSHSDQPEFRYVTRNRGVQPSPLRHFGLPQDFIDLSTGEDPYKLIDLLSHTSRSLRMKDSDSEEDDHPS